MTVAREASEEAYDVIVIGSGMGGLSAAALLARAGKKVLVVERHDRPGGFAHAFQRKKYRFDSAVHLLPGCKPLDFGEGALADHILRLLGVRDRVTFLEVPNFYTAVFPGMRIAAPTGTSEFLEAHVQAFPGESKGVRTFMRLLSKLAREFKRLPSDTSSPESPHLAAAYPTVARYREATVAQAMDESIGDEKLKAALSAAWPYLGLPPSRMSVSRFAALLMSYVHTGSFYCQGTFQQLPNAFVEALKRDGGELVLMSSVRRILVKDGKAAGVTLENGQRIQAPLVISNADALQTYEEMVGPDHLPPGFLEDIRSRKQSLSAFVLYGATSLDVRELGADHEMFLYGSWDHDESYGRLLDGKPAALTVAIPTLSDPSLAPAGEHIICALTLASYDAVSSWRRDKERFTDMLVGELEKTFPDLRRHLTFMETASPRTVERYTLNSAGACYGWDSSPDSSGERRLPHRSPVDGLFLSGHWTQPGGGVLSVIASGVQTVQIILGYPDVPSCLQGLEARPA